MQAASAARSNTRAMSLSFTNSLFRRATAETSSKARAMPSTRREAYLRSPLSPMPAESGWISAPTRASRPGGSSIKPTEAANTSKSASSRSVQLQAQSTASASASMKLTT